MLLSQNIAKPWRMTRDEVVLAFDGLLVAPGFDASLAAFDGYTSGAATSCATRPSPWPGAPRTAC